MNFMWQVCPLIACLKTTYTTYLPILTLKYQTSAIFMYKQSLGFLQIFKHELSCQNNQQLIKGEFIRINPSTLCLKDSPSPLNPFTPLYRLGVCFIHGISLPKHRFGWRPFNLNPGEDSNCTAIIIVVLLSLKSLFDYCSRRNTNIHTLHYLKIV